MVTAEVEPLFLDTLVGDYDDDAPWNAIETLRQLGSREVFEKAAEWCRSPNSIERSRAADVLAQLGMTSKTKHPFPDESYEIMVGQLHHEHALRPLMSSIYALGHLGNPAVSPMIAKYVTRPDCDIRFAVTYALRCFPNEPAHVACLLQLMQDSHNDVRDWATFGLGVQGDIDSPEIHEALMLRLYYTILDVRLEAMGSLAKCQAERVLPMLFAELEKPESYVVTFKAVSLTLGMEHEPEDWKRDDYIVALRARFTS
jgi:HEAT repeat protein